MTLVKAYGAQSATSPIAPLDINRRAPGAHDVQIEILYCGICHSDIHQARNEWGGSIYPMVPGHEIVGKVTSVGAHVSRFKVGDLAGVGCFVDSCRECDNCKSGEEQFCDGGMSGTYNGYERDGKTPTYGGYSTQIVVDENYALHISEKLDLAGVAPLLCAGITTYSPLKHWNAGPGKKVAIMGLGGLGHMGVKIAAAMGAEVTVISTSGSKEADARRLGAHHFAISTDDMQMAGLEKRLEEHDIHLTLTPEARTLIADEGYDPAYGARPLKRVIQKRVQDPLALEMLTGAIKPGDDVEVSVDDGDLVMTPRERASV
mgnify:CR=1 FL=1